MHNLLLKLLSTSNYVDLDKIGNTFNSRCRIGCPRARNLQVHVECTISRASLKPLLRQLKTRATGITGRGEEGYPVES